MSFWGELKRRNVFKVGAVYVIVAWVILQAVSIIFPLLHLPSWTGTFVTVLIIIGFPVALIFAWAFELTADGVKRTSEVSQQESITHVTGRKLNYVFGGLLVLAVALLIFDNYYLDRRVVESEVASTTVEQVPVAAETIEVKEPPKTIAVLPFENLSSDPEQEYFVDGLSEEILNCLTKISGLRVTSRTSSFFFKGTKKKLQDIADELGVEHILEGSVRKAGDDLRITAQLIRVKDDSHLWSETYDRKLEDIFAVQEDIAKSVADELKVKLGIDQSIRQLGGTDNLQAYEHYLVAKGLMGRSPDLEILMPAKDSIDAAIVLDYEFALAWVVKSNIHSLMAIVSPPNQAVAELEASLRAARKAIELEPELADGYFAVGFVKESKGDFIGAELAYREGLNFNTETSFNLGTWAIHYQATGNFEQAEKILEKMLPKDPFYSGDRAHHMINFAFLGYTNRAEEEYENGRELFGDSWLLGDRFITAIRLGTSNGVSADKIVFSDQIYDLAKKHLETPKAAVAELRKLFADKDSLSSSDFFQIALWAAYFEEPEFAIDAARKGAALEAGGVFHIWFPVMHEMRQLPRFKEFVREIGLVDYWNQFGWPEICHPTDDGDFVCD